MTIQNATHQDAINTWFSRRRLGLFLHFGLYAIEGWHEQDQLRRHIPCDRYTNQIHQFNPTKFNADHILDLAESVGMEYVCLTTKHHDGFCLWDTRETDFNIMNSPYGKDLVGELADACHRRDFALGLYYSVADWHHPNYPNLGRHHELAAPKPGDAPDWNRYLDYLVRQVRELCTNYGEVRHFFWDMNVPGHHAPEINDLIRRLQPAIAINNRGFDDGDFGTPERDYDQSETDRQLRFARPTEACNSVGSQSWGCRRNEAYYTPAYLTRQIDAVFAKGGHYLLNVGPDAAGAMPEQAAQILDDIGVWYRQTQEAFGDAEPASELTTNRDILLTRRGSTLYVHAAMPMKTDSLVLAPIGRPPKQATLLNTGETLRTTIDLLPTHWQDAAPILSIRDIPADLLDGHPLVIRLDFDEPLPATPAPSGQEFKG
ncbi:MAG: alpha-L-fucosidase [Kiritimatiellia bacterium]|jgi:alpha-L-fucosidase